MDVDDLIDVGEVALILGLSHNNSVTTYLQRYADFPRPVIQLVSGRCRVWVRQDVVAWAVGRAGSAGG